MVEVRETGVFSRWFKSLRDVKAQARIQTRINRLTIGLLGDVKFFGGIVVVFILVGSALGSLRRPKKESSAESCLL